MSQLSPSERASYQIRLFQHENTILAQNVEIEWLHAQIIRLQSELELERQTITIDASSATLARKLENIAS